jgi:hypothetical protein
MFSLCLSFIVVSEGKIDHSQTQNERNSNWFGTLMGFNVIGWSDTLIRREHCYWSNSQTLNSNSCFGNLTYISNRKYFEYFLHLSLFASAQFTLSSQSLHSSAFPLSGFIFLSENTARISRMLDSLQTQASASLPNNVNIIFWGFWSGLIKFFHFVQFPKNKNFIWLLRVVGMRLCDRLLFLHVWVTL